jgi:hypothetical protein
MLKLYICFACHASVVFFSLVSNVLDKTPSNTLLDTTRLEVIRIFIFINLRQVQSIIQGYIARLSNLGFQGLIT